MATVQGKKPVNRSVGATLQWLLVGAITLVIALSAFVGYQTSIQQIERGSRESLSSLVDTYAKTRAYEFHLAEYHITALKLELLHRFELLSAAEAEQAFHETFRRYEDGLWRVRPEVNDYLAAPTLYLQREVVPDESVMVRAVASYRLLKERGPIIVPPFHSVYMDFVEKGLMVFSPYLDWGANATTATDNHDYPTMQGSDPAANPSRDLFWTPVYFDQEAGIWMVSVIEPLDWRGQWVGTVGHDVSISALMASTLEPILDGTYNILFSNDGHLIVHPHLMDQISDAGGDLQLSELDDPFLDSISPIVVQDLPSGTVIESPDGEHWLAVGRIPGPDWRLVTVYPKALNLERAQLSLRSSLVVAIIALIIAVLLIRIIVNAQILRPLRHLDRAVSNFGEGKPVSRIPVAARNEIGRLARTFEGMSQQLAAREQLLERARRDWEKTFDAVPDLISVLDLDGRIVQANTAFAREMNCSKEACLGRYRAELQGQGFGASSAQMLQDMIAQRSTVTTREQSASSDKIFDVVLAPVVDETGEITGAVEVVSDETEHSLLETNLRQVQKMDAVGRLAGGIAHDFNNLLQVIIGFTEQVREQMPADDPGRESLSYSLDAAERAAALTSQLLIFSRQDSPKMVHMDLVPIVEELGSLVRRLIGEKVLYTFECAVDHAWINGDRNQVDQVLLNLCVNARDAMPDGGQLSVSLSERTVGRLEAERLQDAEPGRYYELVVADTGCGMSEQVQELVFEPFFTTKEIGQGTGLGLATVYEIVRRHDGFVEVESRVKEGARFKVLLPVAVEDEADPGESGPEVVRGGSENILIAEDDSQIRALMVRTLVDAGYHAVAFADGEQLVEYIESAPKDVDLLILDAVMPRMNGPETYRHIDAWRHGIPCIFATGYSPESQDIASVIGDKTAVLTKPFSSELLLIEVRRLLDKVAHPYL